MNWWPVKDEHNEELALLLFVYVPCFASKVVSLREVRICHPLLPGMERSDKSEAPEMARVALREGGKKEKSDLLCLVIS